MGAILGWLLNLFGGNIVQSVLGYLQNKSNNAVQLEQINATKQAALSATSASIILGAQGHKTFWFWFSAFVAPLAFWWIAIFINTIFAKLTGSWGIGEIPPQLVPWAQIIFQNIFYAGAGVAGTSILATAGVAVAKIIKKQ